MKDFNHSRRQLFRLKTEAKAPVRPPWTVTESDFLEQCTRCGNCISHCETGLLIKGSGGYPEAVFQRAGCSFCGECSKVCPTQAIRPPTTTAWTLIPTVSKQCLAQQNIHCRTCGEMCDREAISYRLSAGAVARPEIHHDQCIFCGDCIASCPTDAITVETQQ